jgi:hypothetical protein
LMMVGTYPYLSICHPGSNITHTRHTTHIKDCMFQIVFFWRFYWICSFLYFYIVRNTKSCAYLYVPTIINVWWLWWIRAVWQWRNWHDHLTLFNNRISVHLSPWHWGEGQTTHAWLTCIKLS